MLKKNEENKIRWEQTRIKWENLKKNLIKKKKKKKREACTHSFTQQLLMCILFYRKE